MSVEEVLAPSRRIFCKFDSVSMVRINRSSLLARQRVVAPT